MADDTTTLGALKSLPVLRALPAWVGSAPATPSHTWRVELSRGLNTRWLINGRTFDPGFVERTAELGEVVTWRLREHDRRRPPDAPPPHRLVHAVSATARRRPRTSAASRRRSSSIPHDEVIVAGKMSDYTGKYVVHCHMLDHEDHGLMSQFEVVAPAP